MFRVWHVWYTAAFTDLYRFFVDSYFSVSIYCKIDVPPYIASVVTGALSFMVTGCLFLVDKVGVAKLALSPDSQLVQNKADKPGVEELE